MAALPPPPDPLFLAALHRALSERAARLGTPEAAATVARDGDAILRLLDRFLDHLPPDTAAVCTLSLGWGGGCRVDLVTPDPD